MTLQEKIAQTPKLKRIDSSIESCIKILEQELLKRNEEDPDGSYYTDRMYRYTQIVKEYFRAKNKS